VALTRSVQNPTKWSPPAIRAPFLWQLRTRTLPLGERTLLMGILNVTPDSFSDGGQFFSPEAAVNQAFKLLDEGADLLDLGGESTRPSSTPISPAEEQARILPVLKSILKARPQAILSVDTYHAETAKAALDLGAEIINDVSGLLWDEAMAALLARKQPGVILMHTRGRPHEWRTQPPLAASEVLPLVRDGLAHSLSLALTAGLAPEKIVLDPGFGFGKLGQENVILLTHLADLHQLGRPILAGLSRKRFLTAHLTNPTPEERLAATTAAHRTAIAAGAQILRVHDVPAAFLAANQ
jgi:dihydropteroate synthase